MQQDNANDSMSYQLTESNESHHLMQQNVPSPLTSATVPSEQSVIDVQQARTDHFSRTTHQLIRLSFGSPSLYLAGASNNSDDVLAEGNAAELPNFLKIRRLTIKEDLIKNLKRNEVSTY